MPAHLEVWETRVRHLAALLPPNWLLQASTRLAKEGRTRSEEHVRFEERVLELLDRNGRWRWRDRKESAPYASSPGARQRA
jgi:hypothetical protein